MGKAGGVYRKIERMSNWAEAVARYVCVAYSLIVIVLVTLEVLLRALGQSLSWSEELSRWLLIGISYIGASIGLKHGYHVGITKIVDMMPFGVKKLFTFVTYILVTLFLICIVKYGVEAAMNSLYQTGSVIPFSVVYVKLHLSIGAGLMMIHMLHYFASMIVAGQTDILKLSRM